MQKVIGETHRVCCVCRERKPLSDYSKGSARGHQFVCKPCAARRAKEWREAHPHYGKVRYQQKQEYFYTHRLKRYGLTDEDYEQMNRAQTGRCAICGREQKRLCVDHAHATGKVRGLLCVKCNTRLAALDDKEWLALASKYLERNSD